MDEFTALDVNTVNVTPEIVPRPNLRLRGPAAFRARLAAQAPRWQAMGIDYHRSAQVPWPAGE